MCKKLALLVFALLLIVFVRGCDKQTAIVKKEIVTVIDTEYVAFPVHDTIIKEHQRIVKIPVQIDSVKDTISLTAETKHYKDSLYEVWVSGVDPVLDSIKIFSRKTFITKEVYGKLTSKTKSVNCFVSSSFGLDLHHFNAAVGVEFSLDNKYRLRAGYNVGEYSYPFVGVEYKIGK